VYPFTSASAQFWRHLYFVYPFTSASVQFWRQVILYQVQTNRWLGQYNDWWPTLQIFDVMNMYLMKGSRISLRLSLNSGVINPITTPHAAQDTLSSSSSKNEMWLTQWKSLADLGNSVTKLGHANNSRRITGIVTHELLSLTIKSRTQFQLLMWIPVGSGIQISTFLDKWNSQRITESWDRPFALTKPQLNAPMSSKL